jgi:7,8-dihydropterin-6-yl-methyl-4-(beta-D-ribofuranosyl)aminobenzene 5'-phosphate synthase
MKRLLIWLILSICLEMSVLGNTKNPIITVIYDNNPYKEELEIGWGFSCVIKGLEKTILFDTGGDGQRLLANMKKLDIDPGEIDIVVLSHIHGDHVGGLQSILRKNPKVIVYLPMSFPNSFKDEVKGYGAKIIEVQRPLKICENVHSTGELGTGIKEQSLIVRTDKGLIIITGCAHPGILEVLNKAKDLMNDDILLVMGGYHLGGKGRDELEKIVSSFKKLGVRYVGPCHCTGDAARELFKKEYIKKFINVGVGKIITMEDLK